jgi:hypothetical protein
MNTLDVHTCESPFFFAAPRTPASLQAGREPTRTAFLIATCLILLL